jgi:hypothetical protein
MPELITLIELWKRVLGEPPTEAQFALWGEMHSGEFLRRAILKTAQKNLTLNQTMSLDHKVRFVSKISSTLTGQAAAHAKNRELLAVEMTATQKRGERA